MRIVTWNVGIFSWFKYGPYLSLTCEGHPILHEYFQRQHANFVAEMLVRLNADVVVLQEIFSDEDAGALTNLLKATYPYSARIDTWYHKHAVLFLSKTPFVMQRLRDSEFYFFDIEGIQVIPIHFHSFSATKRLLQVQNLIEEVMLHSNTPVCVLGDTNFWDITKNHLFLFEKDRLAYALLNKHLFDATADIYKTAKAGLNFDKIFLSREIQSTKADCLFERAKYMDHFPVMVSIAKK